MRFAMRMSNLADECFLAHDNLRWLESTGLLRTHVLLIGVNSHWGYSSITDLDEHRLVGLLVAGDREAFEHVYRRHNGALIRVSTGILRNRASAEEVVQDTWVAVLTGIGAFEGRSSLAGWIFSILVNKSKSRAKRDGRIVQLDGSDETDELAGAFDSRGHWKNLPALWDMITPERHVEGRTVLGHVEAAIGSLPPAQRAVLVMRGQQELEAAEVCEILQISEGNMRVLLHRARVAVRNALDRLNSSQSVC